MKYEPEKDCAAKGLDGKRGIYPNGLSKPVWTRQDTFRDKKLIKKIVISLNKKKGMEKKKTKRKIRRRRNKHPHQNKSTREREADAKNSAKGVRGEGGGELGQ